MSKESTGASILEYSFEQDLSVAVLDVTTGFGASFKNLSVTLKVSKNITETITVTLDDALGSAKDAVLKTGTLVAQQDFYFNSDKVYNAGDEVKIYCTNANVTGTVSGKVTVVKA